MAQLPVPISREYDVSLDTVLGFMAKDSEHFDAYSDLERRRRQASMVMAYAIADPVLMFEPGLHDVSLSAAGELQSDYGARPKFARTLTSRVLDARIQGCASLPVTYLPSHPFDVRPLTQRLNLQQIQTVTECTGTAAVRPMFDPSTGTVFYQTFGAHQFTPYLGPADDNLLGLRLVWDGITEYWTPWSYRIERKGAVLEEGPNTLGEVPFSIFRTRRHPRLWWGVADLAVVTLNNIALNKMWSDLMQLAAEQSFAIYVVYEDDEPDAPPEYTDEASDQPARRMDYNWTSGKTVYVPHNGKVETISPDADIKAIADVVETMGQRALDDAYLVDVAQSQAGQSGFALRVRLQPYLNKMASVRREFSEGLGNLLELAAVMHYAGANRLGEAYRAPGFSIRPQFDASLLTPVPVDETVRRYEFEHRIAASSVVDYLVETRGLTRPEAEDRAREVLAATAAGLNGPGPQEVTPAVKREPAAVNLQGGKP